MKEVMVKFGITKGAARCRAWRYRQRGVVLKEFAPIIIEPPDWSELAGYAKKLMEEQAAND
jgi:hypothetical protein